MEKREKKTSGSTQLEARRTTTKVRVPRASLEGLKELADKWGCSRSEALAVMIASAISVERAWPGYLPRPTPTDKTSDD